MKLGITMLINNKDDIKFVTEFPCFLEHPVEYKGTESFCHNISNPFILASQCRRLYICQTMNSDKSNNISLKYQMFTPSGCKDIVI